MTVHVLVPVFNRLALTQSLVTCLREQVVDEPMRICIVDDGSTDGTANWLANQPDLHALQGDGTLFWGGAVDHALKALHDIAAPQDWVLLMNNDTQVKPDFVQHLLHTARAHAPAAVGSVIRDQSAPERLLSLGARIDPWRLLTSDLLDQGVSPNSTSIQTVDALSGRGVLFPWASLKAAGGMRPRCLPHYLADYEVSLRVRKSGWQLMVSTQAAVYSEDEYGSARRALSWRDKWLSVRSPAYLPAWIVFWWEASSWLQRLTLPFRLPLFIVFPRLRQHA